MIPRKSRWRHSLPPPTKPEEFSCFVRTCYYVVLFFAYWFGASRFDYDGDGDFDAADVEAFLRDHGMLHLNFRQSRTHKARKRRHGRAAHRKAEQQRKEVRARALQEGRPIPKTDAEILDIYGIEIQAGTEEAVMEERYLENQIPPWFVLIQSGLMIFLWLFFAVKNAVDNNADAFTSEGGLDGFSEGWSDLRWSGSECENYRAEVWRWWTYQFTHVSCSHVLSNTLMVVILGIPLEGLEGTFKIWLMFTVGVIGGAACYSISDTHAYVVGASGGCYALLGMHFGDLILNWREKKFRLATLAVLIVVAAVDISAYILGTTPSKSSHAAHVGGALAGIFISLAIGKNLKVRKWERLVVGIVAYITLAVMIFVIVWTATRPGPQSIFDAMQGIPPTCWVRQVYSTNVNTASWECVSCWSPTCIAAWHAETDNIATVNQDECYSRGFYYREDGSMFTGL
mmetsp:Transcript_16954/g.36729  ORF Transcript_16954/g.36729 Transcript_16954/m.36729 type:complete len:456 (-) Transcript_16954:389-1756(-)